ncbi:aminotransferase DegT [Terasakiispira papahanaumokuakeensis]|uniref:Aminotransferase DegT n=1 Tax=Terasakiispira papahanaumokuakeensis TaxID=197479 RepID=A0A1E2VAX1_9GAMM|nr:LegC family aminotransferase [Terasakiispira papahanaumokuakeensis]ODC04160.1 aminotransferase DegT [Terasakiispira papahanaumokuakeensis]
MNKELIEFIRDHYKTKDFIPLHEPSFDHREEEYVLETIKSTFVSSVGTHVDSLEKKIAGYTGSPAAVATVNGSSALHIALKLAGVKHNDLVITQPLTFVATCNAITYCGASPIFIDVDKNTLGMSPTALDTWLSDHAYIDPDNLCRTIKEDKVIRACLPMHTFGHPADLDGLNEVARRWKLILVEDAAESLGSFYKGRHTGTIGTLGILSFNGNKIITTGGGGMILSNNSIAKKAKHLTTTAKTQHHFEYNHDEIGYNYRLPNLNAALGCGQLEKIEKLIESKRSLAGKYNTLFKNSSIQFITEPPQCRSNYWLNSIICEDQEQRDELLEFTHKNSVMTRPIWRLMNYLPMYKHCLRGSLKNAEWLEQRVVCLPSSAQLGEQD